MARNMMGFQMLRDMSIRNTPGLKKVATKRVVSLMVGSLAKAP